MPTGAPNMSTLVTTAAGSFQTEAMATLTAIVPIILGVLAVVIAIRFGIKFFKKVGG